VREIVSNVIRHSGAGRLVVTAEPAPRQLELRFADDGRGLSEAALGGETTGYGLKSLSQRIGDLGGTMSLANAGGTIVTLSLPLYLAARPPEPGVRATAGALDSSA